MKKLIPIFICVCFITTGCGSMIRGKVSAPIKPGLANIDHDFNMSCFQLQSEVYKMNKDKAKNTKRRNTGIVCNVMNTFSGLIIIIPWFFIDVQLSDYNLANDVIDRRIEYLFKLGYDKKCNLTIPEPLKPKKTVYKQRSDTFSDWDQ